MGLRLILHVLLNLIKLERHLFVDIVHILYHLHKKVDSVYLLNLIDLSIKKLLFGATASFFIYCSMNLYFIFPVIRLADIWIRTFWVSSRLRTIKALFSLTSSINLCLIKIKLEFTELIDLCLINCV